MTDEEALRAALLELLIEMPGQMLNTPEAREQIAGQVLAAGRVSASSGGRGVQGGGGEVEGCE